MNKKPFDKNLAEKTQFNFSQAAPNSAWQIKFAVRCFFHMFIYFFIFKNSGFGLKTGYLYDHFSLQTGEIRRGSRIILVLKTDALI